MRKLFIFIICFFTLPFFVYSLEEWEIDPLEEAPNAVTEEKEKKAEPSAPRKFRMPNRGFEIGINADVGLSNNFLTINEFFKETLVLDLDRLTDGLKANFGVGVTPFYLKIESKKGWGFRLFSGVDVLGIFDLSGDMLSFQRADDSKSMLGGAMFVSAGLDVFFPIHKLKIKFRPAVYYTLAYMKPDITYAYNPDPQGIQLGIDFNMKIFTAFPMDGFPDNFSEDFQLTADPGVDFSAGVEFPLFKSVDIGLDIYNVPLVPSTMRDYMQISATLGSMNSVSMEELFSSFEAGDIVPVYGVGEEKINRPFKALLWASWRPFLGSSVFSVIPTFGFSVNELYLEPFSLEGGLKVRLDLANFIVLSVGLGYYDHLWRNSADIVINIRLIEIDVGVDLRAHDFEKIWDRYGLGARVGVKLGW